MKNLTLPTIWQVACHTDNVGPGSTFVAIEGKQKDGSKFVELALQKGATQIVLESQCATSQIQDLIINFGAQITLVTNTRQALSNFSAQAWGYPASKLKIIGVTGTKGKTTTVYALRHLLLQAGKKVAMISGVENMIGTEKFEANLTTPQPDYIHMFLAQCVKQDIEYVVMEVSAQALSLNRVDDLSFAGVVFTNLELEHSEFYDSIETYFQAKCQIFNFLRKDAFVVLNLDDIWVQKILRDIKFDDQLDILYFANNEQLLYFKSFYQLRIIQAGLLAGLEFSLDCKNQVVNYCAQNIRGIFNAYNLTCAILCAKALHVDQNLICQAVANFVSAPGRLEIYNLPNGARGVVDYAHTPSSFTNILNLLRSQTNHLIVIFGAGGGRDLLKRPVMGKIATTFCDVVILTNDNPRNEKPDQIIKSIIGNQDPAKFLVEPDRARAVSLAYRLSGPGTIIVLLGKGPDEYQIIGNQKTFFSDRDQLKALV